MASRRVGLYKYTSIDGRWKYVKAVFYPNNKIKAHAVLDDGIERVAKGGYYVLSFARKWESVGNDPETAVKALNRKRGELLTLANGGTVVSEQNAPKQTTVQGTLKAALEAWIQEVIDRGQDAETIRAKRTCGNEFARSCKVKLLTAVTRQHCLQYINAYLQKMGNSDRTRYNKFGRLREFLTREGLDLLTDADKPKYSSDDPLVLEQDELEQFWAVCPHHKKLMYMVFLCCGLRMSELQTLRWVDIDFAKGKIKIQERPEYGFKPKKHHCRSVPINDELLEQLHVRKLTAKFPLVFHTRSGKPFTHLWEDTQNIFRKTDVPLGKGHPHCFRATFCTTLFREGWGLPDVMHVMGHKDSDTTLRYMVPMRDEDLRKKMLAVRFA